MNRIVSAPAAATARTNSPGSSWLIPALLMLAAMPLTFGVLRLLQMGGVSDLMAADAPYLASPVPLVAHIVSAVIYAVLGAFQFSPGIRRRWPRWHRHAGRLLVACGLVVAPSALWLTIAHTGAGPAALVLASARIVFGSAMLVALVLGLAAILRGNVPQHRAWMMRAYAIGLGAGTQMLILTTVEMAAGPPGEMAHALLTASAWFVNLAVAELRIRQPASRRRRA